MSTTIQAIEAEIKRQLQALPAPSKELLQYIELCESPNYHTREALTSRERAQVQHIVSIVNKQL